MRDISRSCEWVKEWYFRAILLLGRCLLSIFCPVDQSEFLSIQLADLVVRPLAYHPVEVGAYRVNDRTGAGADSIFALRLTLGRPTGPIVHDTASLKSVPKGSVGLIVETETFSA